MNRHTQRMNRLVQFIEENLDLELDINNLAKMAYYSKFHFYRLFRAYVGESVYAYRKRLLLERSVKFLQFTDKKITEIALDSGYDNHSSFNEAFKKYFLYSPTQVRQEMMIFESYKFPEIDKGMNMKVEIIILDDIQVIAARGIGRYDEIAAEAWGRIMKFAYGNKLMSDKVRRFGVSHDDPNVTDLDKIRYDACLDINVDISQSVNLKKMIIAGGKYAKFIHKGSYNNLDKSYAYIFNEWLPNSNHKLRMVPPFDLYLNMDPRRTKSENLRTEIHIPLV